MKTNRNSRQPGKGRKARIEWRPIKRFFTVWARSGRGKRSEERSGARLLAGQRQSEKVTLICGPHPRESKEEKPKRRRAHTTMKPIRKQTRLGEHFKEVLNWEGVKKMSARSGGRVTNEEKKTGPSIKKS